MLQLSYLTPLLQAFLRRVIESVQGIRGETKCLRYEGCKRKAQVLDLTDVGSHRLLKARKQLLTWPLKRKSTPWLCRQGTESAHLGFTPESQKVGIPGFPFILVLTREIELLTEVRGAFGELRAKTRVS